MAKADPEASKRERNKQIKWVVTIFLVTILISGTISFFSDILMENSSMAVAFLILLAIIFIGIVFDIIGMAVATADEKPFHAMAARKVPGARAAISLLRNAERVSSICNDVVGDICGIVSGTTAAVIVAHLQRSLTVSSVLLSIAVTALISGLTIGGKAIGKNIAIDCCTAVVFRAGRIMHFFHRSK